MSTKRRKFWEGVGVAIVLVVLLEVLLVVGLGAYALFRAVG